MRPVISIVDPSWLLISAITLFGPLMRKCMPSGTPEPGRSSVRRPAVNIKPFEQPGMNTRIESFGTGLPSCASIDPLNMLAATTMKKTVVFI